jgi:hypothetical protein
MNTEVNASDRAQVRAPLIDQGLTLAFTAHLRGAPRTDLRQAVAVYVADAKRGLTPPQDVIVSLKAHVQRELQPQMGADEFRLMVQAVVGWGIEEYYREP